MESSEFLLTVWKGLGWPLLRLVLSLSVGLMVANLIEALNWTHGIARLASPLVRAGRLSDEAGASFSLSFFSSVSANTVLSEAYDRGAIGRRELVYANLFNSLPVYFLHLPTMFFLAAPLIKEQAPVYVGLTLFAAFLRTVVIVLVGRFTLPARSDVCVSCALGTEGRPAMNQVFRKAWERFKKRIRTILAFTVPIYIAVFVLIQAGAFHALERFLAENLGILSWLHPATLGVVALQLTSEISAGLAAAGAILDGGMVAPREVVLALLVGNVLSSPLRALRHQFPFYAGIYKPDLALRLIAYNQTFRSGSILLVGFVYYVLTG